MSSAAARAEPRPRRSRPRAHPVEPVAVPRPRVRREPRPRVAGGVLWIVLVAVLLAGIVALNVAVLGLNMEVERLDARKDTIQARNAEILSELSTAAAVGRIETAARNRLGLVEPAETTYLDAARRRR